MHTHNTSTHVHIKIITLLQFITNYQKFQQLLTVHTNRASTHVHIKIIICLTNYNKLLQIITVYNKLLDIITVAKERVQ